MKKKIHFVLRFYKEMKKIQLLLIILLAGITLLLPGKAIANSFTRTAEAHTFYNKSTQDKHSALPHWNAISAVSEESIDEEDEPSAQPNFDGTFPGSIYLICLSHASHAPPAQSRAMTLVTSVKRYLLYCHLSI